MRRSQPRMVSRSYTDDENHSLFDFSLDEGLNPKNHYNVKKTKKDNNSTRKKKKNSTVRGLSAPPSPGRTSAHPYPTSIAVSIQRHDDDDIKDHGSPSNSKRSRGRSRRGGGIGSSSNEYRSPQASPTSSGVSRRSRSEARQPNSPTSAAADIDGYISEELTKYHREGLRHFNSNRLSDAVETYSKALRAGLEELAHRNDMIERMSTGGGWGTVSWPASHQRSDSTLLALASSISRIHADLGTTLEIAQQYSNAKKEYQNGLDMLKHTCKATDADTRVREAGSNVKRMVRAVKYDTERNKQTKSVADAYRRLESCIDKNPVDRDNARRGVISSLERLMQIERDALGEKSYGHAKLRLKLAKVKCEGGDIEGGLHDADIAVKTIKSILGSSHAIVGAASLFVAAVYEKRAMMMYDKIQSKLGDGGGEGLQQLTPECKSMITKALEYYADALGPLKFKYDRDNRGHNDNNDEDYDGSELTTKLQPDIGDTFHKIAKLYIKRGNGYALAVDACHQALQAYGAASLNPADVTNKSTTVLTCNFHPNATHVYHDLACLYLSANAYSDAIYAAEKLVDLSRQVPKSSFHDNSIASLPSLAYQIAGDAYTGLHRYEDATRAYQEAYSEFRNVSSSSSGKNNVKGPAGSRVNGATILRKLGMTFYHRGMFDEAKAHLMDALRMERSSKDRGDETSSSNGLPLLLCDISMVHLKCGENNEAIKALRSCLKLYADLGVPEHTAEVKRARQLFKDAQRRPIEGHDDAAASPHVQNSSITMKFPQSNSESLTPLTLPSTNFSGTDSGTGTSTSKSGQGLLQTLLEELASGEHDVMRDSHHSKSSFQKIISAELASLCKLNQGGNAYEVEHLKRELDVFKASKVDKSTEMEQLLLRIKELEAERDQDKMDRAFAVAELESTRKVVEITERSYQELVEAIDIEKEKINDAHATQLNQLQDEIDHLRETSNHKATIERVKLSEELAAKREEMSVLKEECLKSSREISTLMATNRKLQSERDAACCEIDGLKSKIETLMSDLQHVSSQLDQAKVQSLNKVPAHNTDIKKLEYELQTERNRRVILEASLQKEYDKPPPPPACMPMPFGYPPMQMQMYAPDNSSNGKLKILEIDLATEQKSKEMLENIVQEMTITHEEEKSLLLQELSNTSLELRRSRAELDRVSERVEELSCRLDDTLNELADTTNELADTKNQMLQMSCELSSTIDERNELKRKHSHAAKELLATKEDLQKMKTESRLDLKKVTETLNRKEAEVDRLSSENARVKNEYNEAIRQFEKQIADKETLESKLSNEVQRLNNEVHRSNNEVQRLQIDLGTAKHHMESLLVELEATHTDVKHTTINLESTRADLRTKDEQLNQARNEVNQARRETSHAELELNEMTNKFDELKERMCKLQESVYTDRNACMGQTDKTLGKLRKAEATIEKLNKAVSNLKSEKNLHQKMIAIIRSIPQQLEKMLPNLYSPAASTNNAPDDESSNHVLESLSSRISLMLTQINAHIAELNKVIQLKDTSLEKSQWNLSNTTEDLRKLESKYKALKETMAMLGDLQKDYDELLDQYELLVDERESSEDHERQRVLQEERELFECQLKDAVDDLEELEGERDALKAEYCRLLEELARRDSRIRALEMDNELIDTLEKQILEYDAALLQKDTKLEGLAKELQSLRPELERSESVTYVDPKPIRQDTARMDWFTTNILTQGRSGTNPFDDSSTSSNNSDRKRATNPFDEESLATDEIEGDTVEVINASSLEQVDNSNESHDTILTSSESERVEQDQTERDQTLLKIAALHQQIHTLETSNKELMRQLLRSNEEATMCADDSNETEVDIELWKNQLHELQKTYSALKISNMKCMDIITAELNNDGVVASSHCLSSQSKPWTFQEENSSSKGQIVMSEDIAELPSTLAVFISETKHEKEKLVREVTTLQKEIGALKGCSDRLSAQLARSEAKTLECAQEHACAFIEQQKNHQAARENDLALIASLENAVHEKETLLQQKMKQVELLQSEIGALKSQMLVLEESNKALNFELFELSAQSSTNVSDEHDIGCIKEPLILDELQQSLCDDQESSEIRHSIELASINAEFHNALMSMDELKNENLKLKHDIEILSSRVSVEDVSFEEEMNAAHTRFESMENSLKKRVLYLEKEKDKLLSDHLVERINKEEEYTKTRIELCAWKLGT
jgi:chromosome segregation ATPase